MESTDRTVTAAKDNLHLQHGGWSRGSNGGSQRFEHHSHGKRCVVHHMIHLCVCVCVCVCVSNSVHLNSKGTRTQERYLIVVGRGDGIIILQHVIERTVVDWNEITQKKRIVKQRST
jgi:hypothetical protein